MFDRLFLPLLPSHGRLIPERSKPFNSEKRITLNMKTEHTIDKPARPGRAIQIAAMAITGLVAIIWVYFGRLYLIHDPGEWRIANQDSDTRFISSL